MSSRKHVWLDVVLVNLLLIFPWMFLGSAGGLGGIFRMEDNVAVLLDDAGESRCTSILTFLLLGPRRWIEVTHRSSFK